MLSSAAIGTSTRRRNSSSATVAQELFKVFQRAVGGQGGRATAAYASYPSHRWRPHAMEPAPEPR